MRIEIDFHDLELKEAFIKGIATYLVEEGADSKFEQIVDKAIYETCKKGITGDLDEEANEWFKTTITFAFLSFIEEYKYTIWEEINPEFDDLIKRIEKLEEKNNKIKE